MTFSLPEARRDSLRSLLTGTAVAAAALVAGLSTASPVLMRLLFAGLAALLLLVICASRPQASLVAVLAFLPLLGLARRVVGSGGSADPLLLVAPACLGMLVLVAAKRGVLARPTALTRAVLVLQVLSVAGVVYPVQGGLQVGIAGLLFVLVPTLWFWVGRSLLDDATLRTVLRVVAVLGVAGAAYGLYQTYAGLPSYDQAWVEANPTYVALSVGGTTRAFGTFTAAAEYASYVAVAIVVWAALARRRWLVFGVAATVVLVWALALASSRGILVLTAAAVAIVVSARLGLRPKGAVLLAALMLGGLFLGASQLSGRTYGGDRTGDLLAHQIEGLANPFDRDVSTAGVHANMIRDGLDRAFTHPLGAGTGSVSRAATKYGGNAIDSETDLSNSATAFGFPGLICYLAIAVIGARRAYGVARSRRDAVSLAVVGILAVTSMQWLNGGQYALAPLPWLLLGFLDRPAPDCGN
jgi:hypothetical protein